MITEKCNMDCPMCYAFVSKKTNFIELEKAFIIIDRLKSIGINKITFTGGEPLLHDKLVEIIKHAHLNKFKIALSTNGNLLSENYLSKLELYIDEITIPVDGSSRLTHNLHRNLAHFDRIVYLLSIHHKYQPNFDVSTVVTKSNINDLFNILNLLEKYEINKWKIFQYSILNNHQFNFRISEETFKIKTNELKARKKKPIQIDIRNANINSLRSYFNISTSGDIFIADNNYSYKVIGNIITSNVLNILHKANFNFDYHNIRHMHDN